MAEVAEVAEVSGQLLKVIQDKREKAVMFKSTLVYLQSTLEAVVPLIRDIIEQNKELGRSKGELEALTKEMDRGTKLVYDCSKIHRLNYFKKIRYQAQLEEMKNSLLRCFTFEMQAQAVRDQKQTLLAVNKILEKLGMDSASVLKDLPGSMTTDPNPNSTQQIITMESGKNCFMLAARGLCITWGDTERYWSCKPLTGSRFPEVAELRAVCWLEIHGKINTRALSPNTQYAAYLVFKMSDAEGFDNLPVNVSAGITGDRIRPKKVSFDANPNLYRKLRCKLGGWHRPNKRSDEWLEIEMGEFLNSGIEDKEVELSVKETESGSWKRGLVLEGIEVRPK